MDTQHIRIEDFSYPLPQERIAKYPLKHRDESKLLVYNKGEIEQDVFRNIASRLPQGALMVMNNTKVIRARIHFHKATGALIEVFLLEPQEPADYEQMFQAKGQCSWLCMVGNLKKWKEGALSLSLNIAGKAFDLRAERIGEVGVNHLVRFSWQDESVTFSEIIEQVGELPIPPYLNRKTEASDLVTYQTVYSKIKGSVAAPTAGLHFTESVLKDIDKRGIERQEITLHVGAGTFKPVKSEEIKDHEMHTEYISVHKETLEKLLQHGCRAIAVGTTSVRTLESLYYIGRKLLANPLLTEDELHVNQWEPYESQANVEPEKSIQAIVDYLTRNHINALHTSTQIIIAPGYDYKIVRMLVTNFHQPKSTLLLLVSAFVKGDWRRIYDFALEHDFRFLSYGDSSLLIP